MTPSAQRADHATSGGLRRVCGLALLAGLPASLVGASPAEAAPAELAVPTAGAPVDPYGGQLDHADAGGLAGEGSLFEVGLLGIGGVNALALVGASVVDGWRGPTCEQTRRALMTRTDPGTPTGPRPARRRSWKPEPSGATRPAGAHRRTRGLRAA